MTITAKRKPKKHSEVINNNQQAIELLGTQKLSNQKLLCLCAALTTSLMWPDESFSDIVKNFRFVDLPLEVNRYCQRLDNEQRLMFARQILNLVTIQEPT